MVFLDKSSKVSVNLVQLNNIRLEQNRDLLPDRYRLFPSLLIAEVLHAVLRRSLTVRRLFSAALLHRNTRVHCSV